MMLRQHEPLCLLAVKTLLGLLRVRCVLHCGASMQLLHCCQAARSLSRQTPSVASHPSYLRVSLGCGTYLESITWLGQSWAS